MNIDQDMLRGLRASINEALESVGAKYGVKLDAGHASFTDKAATFKLSVGVIADDGHVDTIELESLRANLRFLGLGEDDLKKEFYLGHGERRDKFMLAGYRSRATAKPFLVRRVRDGATFICREEPLKHALETARIPNTPSPIKSKMALALGED